MLCECEQPYLGQFCEQCPGGSAGPSCAQCAPCVNGVCVGNGTIAGDGTCLCALGWTGSDCSVQTGQITNLVTPTNAVSASPTMTPGGSPSATPTPTMTLEPVLVTISRTPTTRPGLVSHSPSRTVEPQLITFSPFPSSGGASSNGASTPAPLAPAAVGAIVFFTLLGAGVAAVWVYANYFGGAPVVNGLLSALSRAVGGGGGGSGGAASVETRGLLKPGMAKGTLSAAQAAGRLAAGSTFAATGTGSGASAGSVISTNPVAGANSYQSF